jgi:epoxyqueuosine reductase
MFNSFSKLSCDLGFLDFGAAKAEKVHFTYIERYKEYLNKNKNAKMEYLAKNIDKREDIRLLVEGAESVLCFLAPYSYHKGAAIASFAYGEDYHRVIKDRLFQFVSLAEKELNIKIKGRVFVDSAPVFEREWARRCGLGFIGRNNFLISPKFGLQTLIGVIVCDIPFNKIDCEELSRKKSSIPNGCAGCGNCLRACPTGALEIPFSVDANRCISYKTVEERESDPNFNSYGSIFGCERCLLACPWNKKDIKGWPEFSSNSQLISSIKKEDWITMDQSSFNSYFKNSSLSRAGLLKLRSSVLISKEHQK